MPLARIDLIKGKPAEYRRAIGDAVYKAMVEILKAPEGDRFQVINEHDAENFFYDPTFFGIFTPHANTAEFVRHVALIWLVIGVGGLVFRTVHLFFLKDVQSGLAWATKILTDPFHDIKLYHKAPLFLLRGEWIDPHHAEGDEWIAEDAAEAPHAS